MLDSPAISEFSKTRPADGEWRGGGGLRDFFLYRDLGVADATGRRVIAQPMRANEAPEAGTGWHRHAAEFRIVLKLEGWARFLYEDQETLVSARDRVHQCAGTNHFVVDYSPDMRQLEVVGPTDFGTMHAAGSCPVPQIVPWLPPA